jgi:hypothetical protein
LSDCKRALEPLESTHSHAIAVTAGSFFSPMWICVHGVRAGGAGRHSATKACLCFHPQEVVHLSTEVHAFLSLFAGQRQLYKTKLQHNCAVTSSGLGLGFRTRVGFACRVMQCYSSTHSKQLPPKSMAGDSPFLRCGLCGLCVRLACASTPRPMAVGGKAEGA